MVGAGSGEKGAAQGRREGEEKWRREKLARLGTAASWLRSPTARPRGPCGGSEQAEELFARRSGGFGLGFGGVHLGETLARERRDR